MKNNYPAELNHNPELDWIEEIIEIGLANGDDEKLNFIYRRYNRDIALVNLLRGTPYPVTYICVTSSRPLEG